MNLGPGVRMLRPAEIVGAEMAATRGGADVFALPSGIASREDFFDAARTVFPLNPPLAREEDGWDALRDSLVGGLRELRARSVVVVWPDPWLLTDFDEAAGRVAAEILSALVDLEVTAVTTILGTRGV